jgi:hypothetical protein
MTTETNILTCRLLRRLEKLREGERKVLSQAHQNPPTYQQRRKARKETSLFPRLLHEPNPPSLSYLQRQGWSGARHASRVERRRSNATKANHLATDVEGICGPASKESPVRQGAPKVAASIARVGNANAPKNDQPALIACE